jgi:ABC-type molybdate transport system substrate-binding protein
MFRSQGLRALAATCLVALSAAPLSASTVTFTGDPTTDFAVASTVTSQVIANPNSDPTGTYQGNFGTPSNLTDYNPYTIYTNADSTNFYVGLVGPNIQGNLDFANLYFSTDLPEGSTVGFEANNSRAFIPGVAGYYDYTASSGIVLDDTSNSSQYATEFSVPFSFFTTDPLGLGFTLATTDVQLRLSQTFGYSVAGGSTAYGEGRFGDFSPAATPEPSTLTLAGLAAFACVIPIARRRQQGTLAA